MLPMLAGLQNIAKFYGGHDVLEKVNFAVNQGERVALVGRNGAGKTTVLKLLSHLEEPTSGRVTLAPGLSIRLLAQDPTFPDDSTIQSVVEGAFTELDALEREMKSLESDLENSDAMTRYHELEEHYRLRGGYAKSARRDTVLSSLKFIGREREAVSGLSGGERTRLALAQILVAQPELLLLDEPTNHLDIQMLEWLEGFLRAYPGAILAVSHDRAFLDAIATKTALVSRGDVRVYDGNYSSFRVRRDAELEIQASTFKNEQRELERLEAMHEQMRIWGGRNEKLAIRARSMQKRVKRFEAEMVDAPPPFDPVARVHFTAPESGEIVLQAGHITKKYGLRTLFSNIDVTVRRGERIAVIGQNGAGKTTLVRALLGTIPSDDARAFTRLGSRVKLGYYDQQLRGVDPTNTLFEEVKSYLESDQQVHDLLGAYLFPYEAQYKKVASLSGGERARLALLKLSLEEHNLLVLDEPTNHLDMEMLESLERALLEFSGTLVMISHDRRFIENLSNQIWLLEDGQFYTYPGGWDYYQEKHRSVRESRDASAGALLAAPPRETPKSKGRNPWKLKREVEGLEARIHALETELQAVNAELADPTPGTDFARLGKRSTEIESELLEVMARWEEASGLLEGDKR
jgi:ATP-binding cassette, subfamily F, member 3